MRAVHGARRGTFEVDALGIVAAAMTGTLEFVFAGFPIRGTAQVSADGGNDEDALGIADHPDAVLILELGVHAESEVGGIADAEARFGLVEGARKEEPQEHQKIDAQNAEHGSDDEAPAP